MVKDIRVGAHSSYPSNLTAVGNTLYFIAYSGGFIERLWKSDGTEAGTVIVKDINPGEGSSHPSAFIAVDNTLYFTANDHELWKSDGTEAGTNKYKEFPNAQLVAQVDGRVIYYVYGEDSFSLYSSDGTETGTVMLASTSIFW